MGNQMGLGADGWASQGKSYTSKTRVDTDKPRFTDDGFYVKPHDGERTLPNGQTVKLMPDDGFNIKPHDGERTLPNETETINGMNFLSDQSKPRGGGGFNNPLGMNGYGNSRVQFAANDSMKMIGLNDEEQEYIDSMSQTYGGMSEGLEGAQSNTRDSIINSLSPELRSKADVYVGEANGNDENNPWRPEGAGSRPDDYAGMGYSEPRVEAGTIESVNSDNSNTIDDVVEGIREFYHDKATMTIDDFIKKYPNPTEIMITWDNLISEYGDANLVKEIEQFKWWQGELSNTTDDSKDGLREIGKWEDYDEAKSDIKTLANNMNDSQSKYIVDNVILNSESISKDTIHVNDDVQQEFKDEADLLNKNAQGLYDTYVLVGSIGAGLESPAAGILTSVLSYVFDSYTNTPSDGLPATIPFFYEYPEE